MMENKNLLVEHILTTEAADLVFTPASGILSLTWKGQVASVVIQEVYELLITHMQTRQVKRIFIDTRLRGRASHADEVWMMQDVTPRLIAAFNSGICLAYILDANHYAELLQESPNGVMHSYSDLFRMKYFLTGDEALSWLQQHQN